MADFDLAIIGGGINGAGIARDAAGRGLSVLLVEQNDLASGTSSASTKLIHGGLRYLEHYAFRLVREALIEREVLLRIAPHLIRPLRFVLPPTAGLRPAWMLRLGLFLYDHLGGRKILPADRDARSHPSRGRRAAQARAPARLRLFGLLGGRCAPRGAQRARRRRARRGDPHPHPLRARRARAMYWQLVLNARGNREVVTARALVNAAGPWVGRGRRDRAAAAGLRAACAWSRAATSWCRGCSSTTTPTFSRMRTAASCSRIPYERDFTLIGTTDEDFKGDLAAPAAAPAEITYLCEAASVYFRAAVTPDQVVCMPLPACARFTTTARRSRKTSRATIMLDLDKSFGQAPLLTVYGGKITTYRRLAEAALQKLAPYLHAGRAVDRGRAAARRRFSA